MRQPIQVGDLLLQMGLATILQKEYDDVTQEEMRLDLGSDHSPVELRSIEHEELTSKVKLRIVRKEKV